MRHNEVLGMWLKQCLDKISSFKDLLELKKSLKSHSTLKIYENRLNIYQI